MRFGPAARTYTSPFTLGFHGARLDPERAANLFRDFPFTFANEPAKKTRCCATSRVSTSASSFGFFPSTRGAQADSFRVWLLKDARRSRRAPFTFVKSPPTYNVVPSSAIALTLLSKLAFHFGSRERSA